MKPPKSTDRVVPVTAYMTDEVFGYEHWRAAQFSSPDAAVRKYAALVIFEDEAERDAFVRQEER